MKQPTTLAPGTFHSGPINPFRLAARQIFHRLKFEWNTQSILGNYWKLKRLQNSQAGKKCVILCNGPSLNKVDFDMLDHYGVFTIGLNKINLMFDKVKHRPDLIACVNPFVIQQNKIFFENTRIPLFLDYGGLRQVDYQPKQFNQHGQLHLLDSTNLLGMGFFASDISWAVCQGYTVTYVALQIAYHLGFQAVTVVGCDHNFAAKGTPNALVQLASPDLSHFDPNYFAPTQPWQLPDLLASEYHYQIAQSTYLHAGRQLYNSTEGGNLETFERKPLADFLTMNMNQPSLLTN